MPSHRPTRRSALTTSLNRSSRRRRVSFRANNDNRRPRRNEEDRNESSDERSSSNTSRNTEEDTIMLSSDNSSRRSRSSTRSRLSSYDLSRSPTPSDSDRAHRGIKLCLRAPFFTESNQRVTHQAGKNNIEFISDVLIFSADVDPADRERVISRMVQVKKAGSRRQSEGQQSDLIESADNRIFIAREAVLVQTTQHMGKVDISSEATVRDVRKFLDVCPVIFVDENNKETRGKLSVSLEQSASISNGSHLKQQQMTISLGTRHPRNNPKITRSESNNPVADLVNFNERLAFDARQLVLQVSHDAKVELKPTDWNDRVNRVERKNYQLNCSNNQAPVEFAPIAVSTPLSRRSDSRRSTPEQNRPRNLPEVSIQILDESQEPTLSSGGQRVASVLESSQQGPEHGTSSGGGERSSEDLKFVTCFAQNGASGGESGSRSTSRVRSTLLGSSSERRQSSKNNESSSGHRSRSRSRSRSSDGRSRVRSSLVKSGSSKTSTDQSSKSSTSESSKASTDDSSKTSTDKSKTSTDESSRGSEFQSLSRDTKISYLSEGSSNRDKSSSRVKSSLLNGSNPSRPSSALFDEIPKTPGRDYFENRSQSRAQSNYSDQSSRVKESLANSSHRSRSRSRSRNESGNRRPDEQSYRVRATLLDQPRTSRSTPDRSRSRLRDAEAEHPRDKSSSRVKATLVGSSSRSRHRDNRSASDASNAESPLPPSQPDLASDTSTERKRNTSVSSNGSERPGGTVVTRQTRLVSELRERPGRAPELSKSKQVAQSVARIPLSSTATLPIAYPPVDPIVAQSPSVCNVGATVCDVSNNRPSDKSNLKPFEKKLTLLAEVNGMPYEVNLSILLLAAKEPEFKPLQVMMDGTPLWERGGHWQVDTPTTSQTKTLARQASDY